MQGPRSKKNIQPTNRMLRRPYAHEKPAKNTKTTEPQQSENYSKLKYQILPAQQEVGGFF